jgi:sugar phosphate isomerase/epimerase
MSGPFKIGLNIDNAAMKPPSELSPGFDFTEIPVTEMVLPYDGDDVWVHQPGKLKGWNLPPFLAASHFLDHEMVTGPGVDPRALELLADRTLKRLAQLGVEVAGIWGAFFPVPDGFPRTKATDQAIAYCDMLARLCEKYGVLIALEPMAGRDTLFPSYLDGIAFARKVNHPSIRVMADLNYFVELNEPLADIAVDPEYCLHVHVQGDTYQPNVGKRGDLHLQLFRILRGIGYQRGVSAASPWIATAGGPFDYRFESGKTLEYLKNLRDRVYSE